MNEEKQKEYLEFAKRVAIKSGKIMKEYFYHQNDYSYKEDRTIVTEVDKKINRLVIEEVKKRFPTHAIDGEEEQSGKSKYTWVCDPIDGTAMYQRHTALRCALGLTKSSWWPFPRGLSLTTGPLRRRRRWLC